MPEMSKDELRRVTATANRLRLVQIDFADENAEARRKFLSEEIERALSAIVPGKRRAFLEELMARFPTWDPNVELTSPEGDTAILPRAGDQELQDPGFLVTRLVDLIPTLSDEERQVLIERLREAGLAPRVQQGWPEEGAKALGSQLQMGDQESVDMPRLLSLTSMLVEFVQSLDQLAWETWRRMAPRSTIRRPARLQSTIRRFVGADPEAPHDLISQDLNKLRRLLASLISAVGQAGRQIASGYLKGFSPSEIELLVKTEAGGLWKSLIQKSPAAKCWEKYVELAAQLTEESIEREIVAAIVSSAERLMGGGFK